MGYTPTGVKITPRFLRKDKRDIKRYTRLLNILKSGRLSEAEKQKIMIPIRRLAKKHEYRYGPFKPMTPEEVAQSRLDREARRKKCEEVRRNLDKIDSKLRKFRKETGMKVSVAEVTELVKLFTSTVDCIAVPV